MVETARLGNHKSPRSQMRAPRLEFWEGGFRENEAPAVNNSETELNLPSH